MGIKSGNLESIKSFSKEEAERSMRKQEKELHKRQQKIKTKK